jgi:hypothetical protein
MRYRGLPTSRAPDAPVPVTPGYSQRLVSPNPPVASPEVMPDNNRLEADHGQLKRLIRPDPRL